jgi:hypothetical protein
MQTAVRKVTCGQQLLYGFLVVARFAEDLSIENGQLICADDQRVARGSRYGFSLLTRQVTSKRFRLELVGVTFVDIRRNRLVVVKKAIEQAAPVR